MGEAQAAAGQAPAAEEVTARRFRVASPATWVILLGGLAALSLAAMIPLSFLAHQVFNGVEPLVIGVPCAGVGVPVARRQPRNPIGWLFLVIAVGLFLGTDGGDYGYLDYRLGHHLPLAPAGVVLEQVWAVATAGAMIGHSIRVDATGGLSWRRSSGERRQQLKWLATGATVTLASLLIAVPLSSAGAPTTLLQWVGGLAWFGVAALPVSIGVAILKYRLYEIDRIISRTLAYAIVTGLLVGVYAGVVLLATQVVSITTPVAVDSRFNRARYDAGKTIAAFSARLQDAVDLEAVQADLAGTEQRSLEPAHVSVWIRGGGQ